jgi:hypothetical protein
MVQTTEKADAPRSVDLWIKWAIRVFAIVVGAVVGTVVAVEIADTDIVIEEISAPAELIQAGYTPSVVAYQILREIEHVDRVATTSKRRPEVGLGRGQVELSLPVLNISIGSIVDYFKTKLGVPRRRLRGGIVNSDYRDGECVYGCYAILLYLDGSSPKHFSVIGPKYEVDKLVREAARKAVETIDPFLLANFYYASRTAEPDAGSEIQRLTTDSPEDPWIVTLQGMMLNRSQKWAEAIPYFDRALALNSGHAPAFNSRCWAKGHLPGQAVAAIEDCRTGLRLDPRSFQTMDSLAYALEQSGQLDQAFIAIKCAKRISGNNGDVETTYQRLLQKVANASAELPTDRACQLVFQGGP